VDQVKAVMPRQVQLDPDWPPVPSPPDQVLKLAASANIIEMPVDRSTVRFYHQLLQEYFAARQLLKQDPASLTERWRWPWLETEMPLWVRPEDNYDPLPPPPPTGWEETTILATGLAAENDDQLVQALIQINPVLAGRCLDEGQAQVDQAVRQTVIETLLATIARPEVALRVRIAAGEVLGYLGDPRLGGLVTVPAGKFLMGSDPKKGRYAGDDEQPQHTLYLPEYRIGKYPLTNAEYEGFIEAGGYRERRWWTEAGWAEKNNPHYEKEPWLEPRYWQASRNKPNQPVVGVSWYEAVAYCRWLSEQTGQLYRLPTEAEWEKAARGPDGRVYPWGKTFEASRLNAREGEQQVRTTTPVGIYLNGGSPFGAFDCAGNVWEWCATKWQKPYPYDAEEDEWSAQYLQGERDRVLRGGSGYFNLSGVRCACRLRRYPHVRFDLRGMRLVSPI
jgi:formylglycine-generating enzyme required for sulfatase activity